MASRSRVDPASHRRERLLRPQIARRNDANCGRQPATAGHRGAQAPLRFLEERRRFLVLDRQDDAAVDDTLAILLADDVEQGEDAPHLGRAVRVQRHRCPSRARQARRGGRRPSLPSGGSCRDSSDFETHFHLAERRRAKSSEGLRRTGSVRPTVRTTKAGDAQGWLGARLVAVAAEAVELHLVAGEPEAEALGGLFLQGLDARFLELDDLAARLADQVVVVLFWPLS